MRLGDLISREDLKESIRKRLGISSLKYLTEQEKVIVDEIDAATTVEPYCYFCGQKEHGIRPQGEWIPVSERLPIRNGVYIVTRIIEGTRITDASYFDGQNTWHRDVGVNHGRPYLNDVIAWQPRPEPYKEGGAE